MFEAVQWRTTPDYAPNVSKYENCKHTLKRVRKFVCESRFMLYNKSQKSTFYRYYIRYALTVKSYHRTSSYIILQHLCAVEHHQTEGKNRESTHICKMFRSRWVKKWHASCWNVARVHFKWRRGFFLLPPVTMVVKASNFYCHYLFNDMIQNCVHCSILHANT